MFRLTWRSEAVTSCGLFSIGTTGADHGGTREQRDPDDKPRFSTTARSSGAIVDAVHDRVLGALFVLWNALGADAVHRCTVLRRFGHRRGAGRTDLRRVPC